MPTLHPVIETHSVKVDSWVPVPEKPWPEFLRLHAGMKDADVALLVAVRVSYGNSSSPPLSPAEIAVEGESVLPGGLLAIDGETRIYPSCCCGIEGWREWLDLLEGGPSPWLGHDPSPGVVAEEGGFRVFPDGTDDGSLPGTEGSIFFSRQEIEQALREVEIDLRGALEALERWAQVHIPEDADGVVEAFAATFEIQD